MSDSTLPVVIGEHLPVVPSTTGALTQHSALIRAQTDEAAIAAWLAGCRSPKTLKAYKREAERLLFWCRHRNLLLCEVTYEDLLGFSSCLLSPPVDWISKGKFPRDHPNWRPMTGPLSPGSHRMSITIIRKMLKWLTDAGYIKKNPGVLLQLGRGPQEAEITRYLPIEAIGLIDDAVAAMANKSPSAQRQKARARFLISLYYETGIRLFEGANADMGDIRRDFQGNWWLYIVGKGDSAKKPVPVSARLLYDLKLYREAFGRAALPTPGEPEPLILKVRGGGRATEEAVANALQLIFVSAAKLADDAEYPGLADLLRSASPHWLRHSCMSHLLDDGTDLPTVQAIARHRSISTTGRYLHKRKEEIHAAVSRRSDRRKK